MDLPSLMLPVPRPCGEPLPTHASTGDPPTLAGSFGSALCWVTAPFLWVLVCARFCSCLPSLESLSPPVLWKSCNQIPLIFKSRFPRDSQSLCQIPRLGSLRCGPEPSQQWRTSLVLLFSSLWVTFLTGMGFDFMVIMPLLPYCFFFVFGCGVSFLVGPSILLLMVVQQLVVILVL